jgi:hypothetical protein
VPPQAAEPVQENLPAPEPVPAGWKFGGMTWTEANAKLTIITVGGTVLGSLLLAILIGIAVVFPGTLMSQGRMVGPTVF